MSPHRSQRNSLSLAGCYGCDSNVSHLSSRWRQCAVTPDNPWSSRRNSFLRLHAHYLASSTSHTSGQLVTSVVLERSHSALPTNRVIPVIQEEQASPTAASPLLPPDSPRLTMCQYSLGDRATLVVGDTTTLRVEDSTTLTLVDLSHSQPLLPGPLSPRLPPPSLSHSCPSVHIHTRAQ